MITRAAGVEDGMGSGRSGWPRPPSAIGLGAALVFWWFSLVPSLLPRSWSAQGVISGLSVAIGYGVGVGVAVLVELAAPAQVDRLRGRWRSNWSLVCGLAALVVVAIGYARWVIQQNDQRDLVGLDGLSVVAVVPAALVTIVVFGLLLALGRVVARGLRAVDRRARRRVSATVARLVAAGVGAVVVVVVVGGFVLLFETVADSRFGEADTGTADGITQPNEETVSGSPTSDAAWDTLGAEGRTFVASAPTEAELAEFNDGNVVAPIRVYAGLRTAATSEQRAAVVVDELDRTGAADRAVVVVVTSTGTGWVDPDAARSIEFMHGGDTAIASMQYSYLPSWISFIVDTAKAGDAGRALNDAVHDWWSALPEPRPELLVFGESLGSYGAEQAFAGADAAESIGNLRDRSDGALFTGPTGSNPIWDELVAERDPDSPVWRPTIDPTLELRVVNTPDEVVVSDTDWPRPRVLYVHHPSDPVAYARPDVFWRPPEWIDDPVGPDVSPDVGWFPVVTGLQVVGDLIAGFSAPSGHGHNYAVDFVTGWAAVAPPHDWTPDDSDRLQHHLGLAVDDQSMNSSGG